MASKNGDQDFAARMRGLMEARELSVYALVTITGLSESSLYGYVNARIQPSLYALKQIRRALCCDWDELLGE